MSTAAQNEFHPYGLPMGTVRGFLSVLICSFFWIFLILPEPPPDQPPLKAPLGHFFLLTLVFLAFASQPITELRTKSILPWLMRVVFVGGSAAVLIYVGSTNPQRISERLTPNPVEITEWPVLLACLAGGFGTGLFLRFVLGRNSHLFMTIRAWVGVIAMLLLLFETIFQFVIIPNMTNKPTVETMQAWEGVLIATVAGYFGSRT
ncbi:MAG: hypothetical protein L0241_22625 [Planctomycetia bacterium]|nr:hypothetical protein [Planctomycetia bacterium]